MLRSARIIMRWRIRALQPKDVAHRQHIIDSLQVYVSMFSGPLVVGIAGIPWGKNVLTRYRLQPNYVEQIRTGGKPMMFALFHPMSVRPCVSRAHYLRHLWLITVSCSTGISRHLDTTLCVNRPSTQRIAWTNCGPSVRHHFAARSSPRCSEQPHWA